MKTTLLAAAMRRGLLALMAITYLAVVVVLVCSLPANGAAAAPVCRTIVHRAHWPAHDEEQQGGIKASSRWRWGAELDARVTLDGRVVMVHDDTLKRITGGKDTRAVEDLTFRQVRRVKLAHGGRVISLRAAIAAAKRNHVRLLVELKRYSQHAALWDQYGHAEVADAITDAGMGRRVYVGGSGAVQFMDAHPEVRTFYRIEPADSFLAANFAGFDLVQVGVDHFDRGFITDLRGDGHAVTSRNVGASNVRRGLRVGLTTFQSNRGAAVAQACRQAGS